MIVSKLKNALSNQFLQNVGWLGIAEIANRVFRLGTTVTLARIFSTQDYGLMAEIYIVNEFANILTLRGGIGAKIIQTDQQNLEEICRTSYWLNWLLCGSVFLLQCAVALGLFYFYDNAQLGLQLATIGLTYLMFPLYIVQAALIERENRLKINAACTSMQALISNIVTIGLAIAGLGTWAIVWAMVLSTPVWILISLWQHPWRPSRKFQTHHWREITNFGKNLLGIQLLSKTRSNIDYILVGQFLGVDALGLYYFAYNAGEGFTSAIVYKFMLPLFPYICAVRTQPDSFRKRYWKSFRAVLIVVTPIVLLQSLLAPIYVPIIFGERWVPAIPILILVCLSVLPDTLSWISSTLLNAIDKTHFPLYFELVFVAIFSVAILSVVKFGILFVAITVLSCHLLAQPIFSVWAHYYTFGPNGYFFNLKKSTQEV